MEKEDGESKKLTGWQLFYREVGPQVVEKLRQDGNNNNTSEVLGKAASIAGLMWQQLGDKKEDWRKGAQARIEDLETGVVCEELRCPCGKLFKISRNYRYHKKACKNATCSMCNEICADMPQLKKHMALHLKKYECHVCSRCFVDKFKLSRHLITHIEKRSKKIFKCEFCPTCFSRRDNLRRHVTNLHPEVL